MFDNYLHFLIVRETAILLIKSKVSRMEVEDEGWRGLGVFFEDIRRRFHCSGNRH